MNLSPAWVQAFERQGIAAVHWSQVGEGTAPDSVLLEWANDNGCVVFTNDLDFGAILAATSGKAPSVIQVRSQDVTRLLHSQESRQLAFAAELER